ncbi:MAG: hypothetical protein NC400_15035, partial [Clostridium sp.]|nr:hypothetical protein [Clostridium sp.]
MEGSEKTLNLNQGGNKKIIYIVIAALVVVGLIAGFMINRHNEEVKYQISSVVREIQETVGNSASRITYPEREGLRFEPGGWYDEIKNNKKFAQALIAALQECCTTTRDEEQVFYSLGIGRAYRTAAVLEYLEYQNEQVKAALDDLTAQALAAAEENGILSIYSQLLPFSSLTYYTGSQEQLSNERIEAAYYAEWQQVKQQMSGGEANLTSLLKSLAEVISAEPITVGQNHGGEAIAVNEVYIPQ